jgi:5-hydroxyisourate hydrolase-like protein (transthyretin family)
MYTIKYSQVIGITPISSNIPNEFKLYQNYPNPFNVSTKFKVQISKLSHVRIIVYDVLGRTIAALVNEELKPGTYEIQFDGTNFSSGVYFYRMETQYFTEIKKMVLLK